MTFTPPCRWQEMLLILPRVCSSALPQILSRHWRQHSMDDQYRGARRYNSTLMPGLLFYKNNTLHSVADLAHAWKMWPSRVGGGRLLSGGTMGSLGPEVKQLSINRSQKRCTCITQAVLYKVKLLRLGLGHTGAFLSLSSRLSVKRKTLPAFVSAMRYKN